MTLHLLAQIAQGEADLSRAILYVAGLIVVSVMGWVISVTRRVDKAVTRLTDYLFGYQGENGVNSELKKIRSDLDVLLLAMERRSGASERRIPLP